MTASAQTFRGVNPATGEALDPEFHDANPRGIWRLLDGEWTKAPVAPAAG